MGEGYTQRLLVLLLKLMTWKYLGKIVHDQTRGFGESKLLFAHSFVSSLNIRLGIGWPHNRSYRAREMSYLSCLLNGYWLSWINTRLAFSFDPMQIIIIIIIIIHICMNWPMNAYVSDIQLMSLSTFQLRVSKCFVISNIVSNNKKMNSNRMMITL